MSLLLDNSVPSKVKILLVSAVAALGVHLATSGPLLVIQKVLAVILGPFAFLPAVLLMLITLDICYKMMASEMFAEHEKKIFGEEDCVQADLRALRDYVGASYEKVAASVRRKHQKHAQKLEQEGLVKDDALTDEIMQKATDQVVEIQTSSTAADRIADERRLLEGSPERAQKALADLVESTTE